MFGLFKKKTEVEVLQEKYAKLMEEAYRLSSQDRTKGDAKTAEAEEILKKIDVIKGRS